MNVAEMAAVEIVEDEKAEKQSGVKSFQQPQKPLEGIHGSEQYRDSAYVYEAPGGGGHSLLWPIRGRAAGQGMVFGLLCPKQGIQFYANLS